MAVDWIFTIKILLIMVFVLLVVSAWDEVIDRIFFDYFELDRENTWSWIILALCITAILFIILIVTNIELHELLGLSELVDKIVTGQSEKIQNGILVHTKI